jgi:trimethylamine:corrinoid methyltransferase-like protein
VDAPDAGPASRPDPVERARERVRAILAEHRPPPLAPDLDTALRRLALVD